MARIGYDDSEPCYVISIAAKMIGVHAQTLRYYEKVGIVDPSRSHGNIRLYSERDIAKLRYIKALKEDLGINLAGVEVILRLAEQMAQIQKRLEKIQQEVKQLKEQA